VFEKNTFNRQSLPLLWEILKKDRFNVPELVYIHKPKRAIYDTAGTKVTILTLKPIEVIGDGKNTVVNQRTLDFIKALCITDKL